MKYLILIIIILVIIITIYYINNVSMTYNFEYYEEEIKNKLFGWNTGNLIPDIPLLTPITIINNTNINIFNTNVINIYNNLIIDLTNVNMNMYFYIYNSNQSNIKLTIKPSTILGDKPIEINLIPSILYFTSFYNIKNISTTPIDTININNYLLLNNTYNQINNQITINTLSFNKDITIYLCNTNNNIIFLNYENKNKKFPLIPNVWYSLDYYYNNNLIHLNIISNFNFKCPSLEFKKDLLYHYSFSKKFSYNKTIYNISNIDDLYNGTASNDNLISYNEEPVNDECINFYSNNDYVIIPPFQYNFINCTISIWFKSDESGNWARIFDFGNGPGKDNILLAILNNCLTCNVYNSPTTPNFTISNKNVNDNIWHHIVWSINNDGLSVFYLDGIQVSQNNVGPPNNVMRNNNYLGKSNWNDPFLNGSLSDFRIYRRVLTNNEILALYNNINIRFTEIQIPDINIKIKRLYNILYGILQDGKNIDVTQICYKPPIFNNNIITIPQDDGVRCYQLFKNDPAYGFSKSVYIKLNNNTLIFDASVAVTIDTTNEKDNILIINSIKYDLITGKEIKEQINNDYINNPYNATLTDPSIIYNNKQPINDECVNLSNNNYVTLPVLNINFINCTISVWFNSINSQDNSRIFDFGNGSPDDNLILFILGNKLNAVLYKNSTMSPIYKITDNNINDSKWHNIVWLIDNNGFWNFYFDGKQVYSVSGGIPNNVTRTKNYIGKSYWNTDPYFNGSISDFRIYQRLLSDNDITNLYNNNNSPLNDLIIYYPFSKKYTSNLTVYNIGNTKPRLYQILYGIYDNNKIDITNICYNPPIFNNNIITIPSGDGTRNDIFTDPIRGSHKYIYISLVMNLLRFDFDTTIIIDTTNEKDNILIINSIKYDLITGKEIKEQINNDYINNPYNATLTDQTIIYNNKQPINDECVNLSNNNYVTLPVLNINFINCTISLWFNSINSQDYSRIFDFGNGSPDDNLILFIFGNKLYAVLYKNSTMSPFYKITDNNINDSKWHNIVWSIDNNGFWNFYFDGKQVYSVSGGIPNNVTRTKNYIGKSNWNNDPSFNGSISEFRIYQRLLSDNDITNLYNNNNSPLNDLIIYYPFSKKYTSNLTVYNIANTKTRLYQILYGTLQTNIDVTNQCYLSPVINNNIISIPSGDYERCYNVFKVADPVPGVLKSVYIKFKNNILTFDTTQTITIDSTNEKDNILIVNSIKYDLITGQIISNTNKRLYKILWGTLQDGRNLDITNVCYNSPIFNNNIITIPSEDGLRNKIFSDPAYGSGKKIYIYIASNLLEFNGGTTVTIDTTNEYNNILIVNSIKYDLITGKKI
jgi:hypothetical protein